MMSVTLHVPDAALERLREVFIAVEGSCNAWTDEEVVARLLVRGAMDYAKSVGKEWSEVSALATEVRGALAEA